MKCEIIDLNSYREKKQQEELDELAEKVRAVVEEYAEEQPYGIYVCLTSRKLIRSKAISTLHHTSV